MPTEPQNMLAWVMTTNKPNQQRKFTLLFIDLFIAGAYNNWIFAKISRPYLWLMCTMSKCANGLFQTQWSLLGNYLLIYVSCLNFLYISGSMLELIQISNFYMVFNCIEMDILVECITAMNFFSGVLVVWGVLMSYRCGNTCIQKWLRKKVGWKSGHCLFLHLSKHFSPMSKMHSIECLQISFWTIKLAWHSVHTDKS